MSDSKQSSLALSVLAVAGVGILGYGYYRTFRHSPIPGDNKRTAVAYLDSAEGSEDTKQMFMFPLNSNTTLAELKAQIATKLGINNPRLFLHKNNQEITPSNFDNLPEDIIVIVTPDGYPLKYVKQLLSFPQGPPPKPWIGNTMDLLPNIAKSSLKLLAGYGPVFTLKLLGSDIVFIADPELVEQIVTQPKLWAKLHMKKFKNLRDRIGDGLFTSDDDEDVWHVAHRILLPAFSANGMKQYFHMVLECSSQLEQKFEQLSNSRDPVDINDWATRFTLEVIGRVAFGIDFDSYEERPAFLEDLEYAFCENLLTVWQKMIPSPSRTAKVNQAWVNINKFIQEIIESKRAEIQNNPQAKQKKDLITLMLCAEDPVTHTALSNDNIRSQILTFLVAGHDSTSSAITSLLYQISANPEVEFRIIQELNDVIGNGPMEWHHLAKLEYCQQVIKENLRLFPPAGGIRKTATADTTLGPYEVKKGTQVLISFWGLHNNPAVWPNPQQFNPDRFSSENVKTRNQFAHLPFSTGPRGCIGQQLSVMEQKVFLATAFRHYCFRLHMSAKITITFPLFIKPNGVIMVISRRPEILLRHSLADSGSHPHTSSRPEKQLNELLNSNAFEPINAKLFILYGSNMETSFGFAQQIESQAQELGFSVQLLSLDQFIQSSLVQEIQANPTQVALIIISSTYNGEPPDNAVLFKSWMTDNHANNFLLAGVKYCVFGCGNSQWKTFQMFPLLIDQRLSDLGATRLRKLGKGDADSSIEDDFSRWSLKMWVELHSAFGLAQNSSAALNSSFPQYHIELVASSSNLSSAFQKSDFGSWSEFAASNKAFVAELSINRELQQIELTHRSTRHVQLSLPPNAVYQTGDHLAVCGFNSENLVQLTAKLLRLNLEQYISISSNAKSRTIPHNIPISVRHLLECFIDLQAPVNRNQLSFLATKTKCPPERDSLLQLASTEEIPGGRSFDEFIVKAKRTLLEILEEFASVELSLEEFLSISTPLRPRYYSIASSSSVLPNAVELTVGVVAGSTPTGRKHLGVCSNFLANLEASQQLTVFVKDTKSTFRLPSDKSVPVIMVGAGTGLAPFRGFLQERKFTGATGKNVLFFGCRTSGDYLYQQELEGYVQDGSLFSLQVAFSRNQSAKVYVQHKIVEQAKLVYQLLQDGAYIYVCGDAKFMAPAVRKAFSSVIQQLKGISGPLAEEYISHLAHSGRYNEDVWAS